MRNILKYLGLFVLTLFLFSCSKAYKGKSGGPLKEAQANVDVKFYSINLDVNPKEKLISGYTSIEFSTKSDCKTLIFDLENKLTITEITLNDNKVPFIHEKDLIYINSVDTILMGKQVLKVTYHGKPREASNPPWDGGFTWETDDNGNPWISITCQLNGAKIFYPNKDHPSDEPDLGAELIISVPSDLVVAGPGLLIDKTKKNGKSIFHWRTNYPINTYSILFNIGKYEVVSKTYTTIKGNTIPMVFYVLENNKDKADYHLDLLARSTSILEKYFGEYPWINEKIGICETPHLGMEHQTMNAYGNKFKYKKVAQHDNDWLMHHELGHEWWGNKVSVKDFADLWIHEGICNYADALNVFELGGDSAYQAVMEKRLKAVKNNHAIVQGKDLSSDIVYHGDIYTKGGFFMHSLRFILGDSLFFPTLKELATNETYTYQNLITTADVEKLFSSAYGNDLSHYFNFYLKSTKTLKIVVERIDENKYKVSFKNYKHTLPIEIKVK